jgi:predicted transcriptional regulator YdeE
MSEQKDDVTVYMPREVHLPAFDVTGFTKIVPSGGELYDAVRTDGRWEVLRELGGDDATIYGVASLDKECRPAGHYRYTLGVKAPVADTKDTSLKDSLFSIHIRESDWVVFTLESFIGQFGKLWGDDPYQLVKQLNREFNTAVGLHIDVYPPSYASDSDRMEFWMPVKQRG